MIYWDWVFTITIGIFIGHFVGNILSGFVKAVTDEFIKQIKKEK
ncbi:MAG: hypothetical protein ACFFD1_00900 [Candidatus Thorarchaeota archaeon]